MDGCLVAPAVFKTVASRLTSGWVGSIPTHSRKFKTIDYTPQSWTYSNYL